MEFTNTEVSAIQQAAIQSEELQAPELSQLQLALVGGGNIIIMVG